MTTATPTAAEIKAAADKREAEIKALLAKLAGTTSTSEKKKIRRALRTRDYYISRQAKVEAPTPEPTPEPTPKVKAKPAKGKKGKVDHATAKGA